ncbi:hypothetical protein NDU88_006153 [Pleurodeles waltl]|uniref:Uncharacterized protein n=1 Tax=Pleurodeles waltl TaxID=8319 RepID=A0AAV7RPB3_PLEWA|nr:hypothetical protein NDU88_006153 [Pleurodeles waltl]
MEVFLGPYRLIDEEAEVVLLSTKPEASWRKSSKLFPMNYDEVSLIVLIHIRLFKYATEARVAPTNRNEQHEGNSAARDTCYLNALHCR